jgi:OOP family OmpA-OmpF porin
MLFDKRFPLTPSAALICLVPLLYCAPAHAGSPGYLTDSAGNPVRSPFGECWHTRYWQPGSRFADCEPAPVVEAPTPVVEAPAPKIEAPAPVAETPPAPAPVPQNIPFRVSMDAFFDFGQATLRPEGKAALDELARRLAVTQYDKLTIVGHAERIGPAAYNQKLSERRASAMREYLIAQGIDAGKISSSGVGESEPVASCPGLRGKRLIDCLQPDRSGQLTAVGSELRVSDASR